NLARCFKYAKKYDAAFKGLKGIKKLPYNSEERKNSYWWYPIIIDLDKLDIKADKLVKALAAEGIPCYGIQWPEAYEEKAYKELNGFGSIKFPFKSAEYTDPETVDYSRVLCPNAKRLRDVTFSLFLHPTWGENHIQRCIDGVKKVFAAHYKQD
ncbi:MAG: DegT/DnrJ/EryC1/StrS family aminotransferase, partial [Ruminiclostridium sp.]|nr:DegT/DnrJ/EryC1/StrS family aminotransferase [Ruminiclostridium sp.]